ncbi:type I restriction enzyme HsdR N-terminal domain-containing protein [Mucilaginibacter ginkgonis]|uniref:Type I restriction enzyme HsdR N-terminal domain-containing protein n=2 Tax=Mucilaginibacter ginkgonis TaxID=2682091 RepID=A0A6I4I0Y3_9SPHI|nr:type I restriction enzyme HsdR N-terminal domain-containing protein [Mucilaginibacter ginkgonis]
MFDEIRKKEILVTPEEWVRQHFIRFLIGHKGYPKSLIKVEGGLKLHGMQRRSDILLHNNNGQKIGLVECKAPGVPIDQKVFEQAANYNMVHKVQLLVVTNGLTTYQAQINFEEKNYKFLEELPAYNSGLGNR